MKQLPILIVLAFLAWSCKPVADSQNKQNEPGSIQEPGIALPEIASQFPGEKLNDLIVPITDSELATAINDGESKEWKRAETASTQELLLKNKQSPDNSIRFTIYRGAIDAMIAVQQENGKVVTTKVWEYRYQTSEGHADHWNQHLLPEYKLTDFFDERIVLREEFTSRPVKPYLTYEPGPASITVSVNRWEFMREVEGKADSPDPMLIKYKYILNWNDDDFVPEKVKEAGYNDVLVFTSTLIETTPDGPGPHEFDCPHGVSVKTSSTLAKQGKYSYEASNMLSQSNAWSEGVEGEGIGEWIEFTITSEFHIGDTWQIGSGNQRSKDAWQANNRIRKLKVLVDDQVVGDVMLANVFAYQGFNIAPFWLKDPPAFKKGTRIRFVIEDIYKGSKYNDTLISYFVPTGNCG